MKICIVGNLPKPYGGVATQCYYVSRELAKCGHSVFLLDLIPDEQKDIPQGIHHQLLERFSFGRIFLYFLRTRKLWHYLLQLIRVWGPHRIKNIQLALNQIINLQKLHQQQKFEIIHSHHARLSLGVFLFAKANKIPFVLTIHGEEVTLDEKWQKERRANTYLLKNVSHIITVSEFTGSYIKKRGFRGKTRVIPNGVDPRSFKMEPPELERFRSKYSIPVDRKILLYLSYFGIWKGPDVFLKSLCKLNFSFQAYMIGFDAGYFQSCKELAVTLGISDRVKMFTDVPFSEVVGFYNVADVFIFPTKYASEGFGIVALEAMASSTPVIASRIAAIPEVVKDGVNGLLFEPDNPTDLANQIERLIGDQELYHRLQKNGIDVIHSAYNWERIAQQFLKAYRNIQ